MTTAAAATTSNALAEIYSNFGGGNILCDKVHMEHVTTVINTLEKKKIKYKIIPMPVYGDDGLEVTFAIVIVVDKKNTKRNKKSISNNKYILFNSWYTKNRNASWPNSHTMWNLMKTQSTAKPFVEIFDFMEKVGKTIIKSSADTSTNNDVNAADVVNENNAQRIKLYNEFYKITTYTFENNTAPSSSFIYDIKLNKSENGLDKLNRQTLEIGIEAFKNILIKHDQSISTSLKLSSSSSSSNNKIKESSNKIVKLKKRIPIKTAVKKSKKEAAPAAASPMMAMENDQSDDTQMSYS